MDDPDQPTSGPGTNGRSTDGPGTDGPGANRPGTNGGDEAFERPIDRFRRTTTGTVIAAGLLGVRDALEGRPEQEEVTIVSEAPTRPVGDVDVVLDPDHPERTIAIVRRPPPEPPAEPPPGPDVAPGADGG